MRENYIYICFLSVNNISWRSFHVGSTVIPKKYVYVCTRARALRHIPNVYILRYVSFSFSMFWQNLGNTEPQPWSWTLGSMCGAEQPRLGWVSSTGLPQPHSEERLQREFNKLEFVGYSKPSSPLCASYYSIMLSIWGRGGKYLLQVNKRFFFLATSFTSIVELSFLLSTGQRCLN